MVNHATGWSIDLGAARCEAMFGGCRSSIHYGMKDPGIAQHSDRRAAPSLSRPHHGVHTLGY